MIMSKASSQTDWGNPLALSLNLNKIVVVVQLLNVLDSLQPLDCSPPGSFILEILQARVLEWVAISFSRVSSPPRD